MDRATAHKLVDEIFDQYEVQTENEQIPAEVLDQKRELPEGKRVVRTKSSGDRVYLIDEVKKTRQWVQGPDVLAQLGFDMSDVTEVEDTDLMKYQMGAVLYKVE